VPESGGEQRRRGNRNHAQAGDPASRLMKWAIVIAVATIVVAIGSCLASWMAWYSFKAQRDDARQLLQAQIASELNREFDSKEMRRARRVLASELLTRSANASDYRVFDFFDKVATYQHDQRIDGVTIYEAFSYYVVRYWLASRDTVKGFRRDQGDDQYHMGFEDLSDWMLSQEAGVRGRTVNDVAPSAREIDRFLHEEAALVE
jgi:hypothetical protein